jgi:hypothetical protein
MGSKRNSWKKLAMAVAVPGIAVGTLAGVAAGPAMAGTTHPHPAPWIETFHGDGNGPSGNVNIWASGAFNDHGHLNVNSSGPFTTVHLSRGSLYVKHNQGWTQTHVNPNSCWVTSTNHSQYQIVGGSGHYQHISGHGDATIGFSGVLPRKKNGQCNTKADPEPWTVHVTFDAQGPVHL